MPGAARHPNGVYSIERAYIVTPDVAAAAAMYARVLGMPRPEVVRGTVIMSDMAVFQLGDTGLGIAQPRAPGPAADALARRGKRAPGTTFGGSALAFGETWLKK